MGVESPKVVPLFSVRTTAPFPPANLLSGRSGFIGPGLWRTYVHGSYLPIWRRKNVCGTIPTTASGRDRATQGAVLKYSERLNGASFNFVNGATFLRYASTTLWECWKTVQLTRGWKGLQRISRSKRGSVRTDSVGSTSGFCRRCRTGRKR